MVEGGARWGMKQNAVCVFLKQSLIEHFHWRPWGAIHKKITTCPQNRSEQKKKKRKKMGALGLEKESLSRS